MCARTPGASVATAREKGLAPHLRRQWVVPLAWMPPRWSGRDPDQDVRLMIGPALAADHQRSTNHNLPRLTPTRPRRAYQKAYWMTRDRVRCHRY